MSGGSLNPVKAVKKVANAAGDVVSSTADAVGNVVDTTANAVSKVVNPIVDTAGKVVTSVGKTVDNIMKDPLPTIEAVALTYALGPEGAALVETDAAAAAVASAAVSAANGGKLEDIALNAATAYAGSKLGGAAGSEAGTAAKAAELSAEQQAMIKQVVASSSSTAATTALRGGSFDQVLASGVTGAVSSYVNNEMAKQGFTQTDNKLVAGAVSRATSAILNGKSVSDAIGQSIAATTIAAGLQGKIGQLNKNNELGSSLTDKYDSLKQSADDYFTNNKIDELQAQAQKQYDAAVAARNDYTTVKSQFDTAYNTYTTNKAAYEANNSDTAAYDAANEAAKTVNGLSQKVIDAATAANNASTAYTGTMGTLKPLQTEYNTTYVAPLEAVKSDITNFNTQQSALATDIGQTTAKYQDQLQTDASDLQKQITDQASADLAKQEADRQQAIQAGDWQKGYGFDVTKYGTQDLGITDKNWQEYQKQLQDIYITEGGFTKDWQTVGSDRIHLYDDGTGIGINTETNETYALTPEQVDQMIWNGQLNTKQSGYDFENASAGSEASNPWYKYLGPASPSTTASGAATTPTTAAPAAAKPLPAANQALVKSAADQTNALNILGVLSALDSGGTQDQTQAQPTVAPEAQFLDWNAPLETNPFKQNSTTDASGATKMARGGSIDDLVALLKRG